jgi:molecular chaperone DnaJ
MVEIETIDKRHIEVKIPPGVQYNTALRIPGEGIRRRGHPGDLMVRVQITTPKSVSAEEKELYSRILDLEGNSNNKKGFFSGLMGKKKEKK